MRLNVKQSQEVEKVRRRVTTKFKKQQSKRLGIQRQLIDRMVQHRARIDGAIAQLLGVHPDRVVHANLRGRPVSNENIKRHFRIMRMVTDLKDASIEFGMFWEKGNCFTRIQEMWNAGAISKVEYVLRYLKQHPRKTPTEAVEYVDLSFGVGGSKKIEHGKGIPDDTKRQYRSTLSKRKVVRKMKRK